MGLSAPALGLYHVHDQYISNVFFSETAWPIKAKFHVEPQWKVGMKVYKLYIDGLGHMTKMATTPMYGKNLEKKKFLKAL